MQNRDISDAELVANLRQAASTWFKNSDLLLLEELIRRYHRADKIARKYYDYA